MTKPTSRPSVRATPKPEPEPDTNGTPPEPTEAVSELGSRTVTQTRWILEMANGDTRVLTVPGDGRVTIGGPAGRGETEARFYPTKTSKDYIAAIRDVKNVYRDDVHMALSPSAKSSPTSSTWMSLFGAGGTVSPPRAKTLSKASIEELADAIVKGVKNPDPVEPEDPEDKEEDEVEVPF